jgi:hypothetical protein
LKAALFSKAALKLLPFGGIVNALSALLENENQSKRVAKLRAWTGYRFQNNQVGRGPNYLGRGGSGLGSLF